MPEARLKAGYYLALEDAPPYFSELQLQTFAIIMAEPSIMDNYFSNLDTE